MLQDSETASQTGRAILNILFITIIGDRFPTVQTVKSHFIYWLGMCVTALSPQLSSLNVNNIGIDFAKGHCTHTDTNTNTARERERDLLVIYRFNLFAIK